MQWAEGIGILINAVLLGLVIWALRGYIFQRTRHPRAGEQFLTQEEIYKLLNKTRQELKETSDAVEVRVIRAISKLESHENEYMRVSDHTKDCELQELRMREFITRELGKMKRELKSELCDELVKVLGLERRRSSDTVESKG